MSDVKMSGVEVVDYPAWTLKDFLPSEMAIINRSGLPDPLSLEIVNRRNWREVVTVYGEGRDAKLVLKALTSYDSNQELIAKLQEDNRILQEKVNGYELDERAIDLAEELAAKEHGYGTSHKSTDASCGGVEIYRYDNCGDYRAGESRFNYSFEELYEALTATKEQPCHTQA